MKLEKMRFLWPLALAAVFVLCVTNGVLAKGKPVPSEASNNLSYPVIWAEGVAKALPGLPGVDPSLEGVWWYQWGTNGTDPDVTPASCLPDPDNSAYCDDGIPMQFDEDRVPGLPAADNPMPLVKAFVQKDKLNVWQAVSVALQPGFDSEVKVDLIDWGDNLESNDWYTRSQVRTEVVLFEDQTDGDSETYGWPLSPEYEMRHVDGWGIDEVHGLAATVDSSIPLNGPGTRATVYSPCARLTIQKLLVPREDLEEADLTWMPTQGWVTTDGEPLINPPIYNMAVYEGGDGPGYYSAEINVKGRVIYGYTWNVRQLNDGAGDYRITFSFDTACDGAALNTFFREGITEILLPAEEVVIEAEPDGGGAVAVLKTDLNLTYMDVRILERGGGGGKKK